MIERSALAEKNPPSVERVAGPWRCWNSSATGGPPTDEAVPNMFEASPAITDVSGLIGTGGDTTLSATPVRVMPPTTIASSLLSTCPMMANPTSVPGTAPSSIHRNGRGSTA